MTKGTRKLLAALLCLLLCVSLLPIPAMAEEGTISAAGGGSIEKTEEDGLVAEAASASIEKTESTSGKEPSEGSVLQSEVYVNPLYADVVSEEDLSPAKKGAKLRSSGAIYTTEEEAGVYVRERMKIREESVVVLVTYTLYQENPSGFLRRIMNNARVHTGTSTEGDYLLWQYAGWSGEAKLFKNEEDEYYVQITYTVTYYTSYEQEQEMDLEVADLLDSLQLNGKSRYEMIYTVYNWITENVTYDYDTLDDDNYKLKYTAYAALINGTAVCQGYSVLLYRLLLECGIDCRVITGKGGGEDHAWNIIRIGDLYYDADSTWDAGQTTYRYFLRCEPNFPQHTRGADYSTDSFYEAYPMSEEDYVPDESITYIISETELFLAAGSTYRLTVSDSEGSMVTPVWTSGDDTIAVVNREGTVTAIGEGSTTITARVDETECFCTINVHVCRGGEPVREDEIASTCAAEGSYDEVVYCTLCGREVSRIKVFTEKVAHVPDEPVQENIMETASSEINYDEVIYCTVCGEELERTFHIIVLNNTDLTIPAGESKKLTVSDIRYGDILTPNWTSSDETVAVVDETGVVRAKKVGTASITAAVGQIELPCEVKVLFTDVTDNTLFYYDYVYAMVDEGIVSGYSDGTFRPMNTCNRAAVVTFLWRLAGEPEPEVMATFDDMTDSDDFNKAISWAAEEGITTGYSDNTFRPWNTCNRAAVMTFLWRYEGKPDPEQTASFRDMTGNADFDTAISWASENGITTGWDDNTFRPWNKCNRLAVASFLYRYDEKFGDQ